MEPHVREDHCEHDKLLEGIAELPYLERVTQFSRGSTKHALADGGSILDFRPLYSVSIHNQQRKLAKCIQQFYENDVTEQQLEELGEILQKYTDALKNFEFIHANRWNTLFVKDIAASRIDNGPGSKFTGALISDLKLEAPEGHRSIFRDTDLLGTFNHELMRRSTALGQSLGSSHEQAVSQQRRRSLVKLSCYRFAFAILGGLIIVVPMLILVNEYATAKTQAVISVSIFLFAVGVASFSKTTPENLLVATAAYAAVLMAFLGDTPRNSR